MGGDHDSSGSRGDLDAEKNISPQITPAAEHRWRVKLPEDALIAELESISVQPVYEIRL